MIDRLLDFSGKKVLICGASDGIGFGTAKMFMQQGADVAITGTRLADQYEQDFSGLDYHQLNLNDLDAISDFAQTFDQLDVLVNCVGTVLYKSLEFDIDNFQKILDINLVGAMQLSTAFYPLLEKSQGNIVHLDSVVSIRPARNNPAYSASKAGLVQLTKSLAVKWAKNGVRVNSVAPGMVPTKITANQSTPEAEKMFSKMNPIPRMGTPEDIGGAVLYLASPLASYVTGQQLVVDGGLTISGL